MHFAGTLDIDAAPQAVWSFVTDPLAVSGCAPDVQNVEVLEPGHFKLVVRAGVGPIRATFNLDVLFTELVEPTHAAVRARGNAPGSAVEMLNTLDLEASADGTRLRWTSDVHVTGTIAQMGARLMQGTADKMTQQVFACMKSRLERTSA